MKDLKIVVGEKCIRQCVHLKIDDDLIAQAFEDEKKMLDQKGKNNPTTLVLNKRMVFWGSIAHNGVFRKMSEWGIEPEVKTPFFDASIHQDEYDFMLRGLKYDIKGSPIGKFPDGTPITVVYPKSRVLIKDEEKNKPMDIYVFCKVDLPEKMLHIAGVCRYHDFWENFNLPFEGKVKHPCHFVLISQTEDFKDQVMGFKKSP